EPWRLAVTREIVKPKIALVGKDDVLRDRIELETDSDHVLPGEVEHSVVRRDLHQRAALRPPKRHLALDTLAGIGDREQPWNLRTLRAPVAPTEAFEQVRRERHVPVASGVATSRAERELLK